jgi:ATP-dependent helicase HrpB
MISLPIDVHLPTINQAFAEHGTIIVQAAPGSGKTTRLPPALLQSVTGKVIVLEPRRLAAKLSAQRIAEETETSLGDLVGYRIRYDAVVTAKTRLIFVTEGVFLRMLLDDPELKGVDAVVIDEFHERHIHCDIALAAIKTLQTRTRLDLRLCIMSATIATDELQSYLPQAMAFNIEGRTYPVTVDYLPPYDKEPYLDSVRRATLAMTKDQRSPGDILVFLNGIGEITRLGATLTGDLPGWDILPLTAETPAHKQAQVFQKSSRRKVILATNVAETSVTIPGVTGVIDPGQSKQAGFAIWNGLPTLDIKKVSQASCIQRAGRAGRTAPGVAYRVFAEQDFYSRPAFTAPEIQRIDLTQTMLDVILLADRFDIDFDKVPWLLAPDKLMAEASLKTLEQLNAIELDPVTSKPMLLPLGQKLGKMPIHPRLGRMILAGEECGIPATATLAACLISEGPVLNKGAQAAEVGTSDVLYQLELVLKDDAGEPITPRVVADSFDRGQAQRIRRLMQGISQRTLGQCRDEILAMDDKDFAPMVLSGFPDRVAKRVRDQDNHRGRVMFNFCLGRGGVLAPSSVCRDEELIVAIDASESVTSSNAAQAITIWLASAVSVDDILKLGHKLLETKEVCTWNDKLWRVDAAKRLSYGALVLKDDKGSASEAMVEETLARALTNSWPKPFADALDLESYHARAALLKSHGAEVSDLPVFEGEMFELFLASICEQKRSFDQIAAKSLYDYIYEQLSYEQQRALDQWAPLTLKLRNGRELKIHYQADAPPKITGLIQDFYGLDELPKIMQGRLALSIHLLGPKRTPLQVTGSLAGFWQQTYPKLKPELSRNYPRHHWPDDPSRAPAVLLKRQLTPKATQ